MKWRWRRVCRRMREKKQRRMRFSSHFKWEMRSEEWERTVLLVLLFNVVLCVTVYKCIIWRIHTHTQTRSLYKDNATHIHQNICEDKFNFTQAREIKVTEKRLCTWKKAHALTFKATESTSKKINKRHQWMCVIKIRFYGLLLLNVCSIVCILCMSVCVSALAPEKRNSTKNSAIGHVTRF